MRSEIVWVPVAALHIDVTYQPLPDPAIVAAILADGTVEVWWREEAEEDRRGA